MEVLRSVKDQLVLCLEVCIGLTLPVDFSDHCTQTIVQLLVCHETENPVLAKTRTTFLLSRKTFAASKSKEA